MKLKYFIIFTTLLTIGCGREVKNTPVTIQTTQPKAEEVYNAPVETPAEDLDPIQPSLEPTSTPEPSSAPTDTPRIECNHTVWICHEHKNKRKCHAVREICAKD